MRRRKNWKGGRGRMDTRCVRKRRRRGMSRRIGTYLGFLIKLQFNEGLDERRETLCIIGEKIVCIKVYIT